jgi:hypothetical protein
MADGCGCRPPRNLAVLEDSPYPYFRGKDRQFFFRLFRSASVAPA